MHWNHTSCLSHTAHAFLQREATRRRVKKSDILAVGYHKMTAFIYRRSSTCGICRATPMSDRNHVDKSMQKARRTCATEMVFVFFFFYVSFDADLNIFRINMKLCVHIFTANSFFFCIRADYGEICLCAKWQWPRCNVWRAKSSRKIVHKLVSWYLNVNEHKSAQTKCKRNRSMLRWLMTTTHKQKFAGRRHSPTVATTMAQNFKFIFISHRRIVLYVRMTLRCTLFSDWFFSHAHTLGIIIYLPPVLVFQQLLVVRLNPFKTEWEQQQQQKQS